jgi:hypothetical protein
LEYHFQINNNGDLSATAVTATIDLLMQTAPTVEFVDSDSLSMCTQTIYQISCVLGQINSGGTDDTELVIKITPSDIGSLQVNTLITLDQDDAIPSNNQTTLVYGIQSAGNKLTNDFNRSSGGSGRLGPWLMMLFITALLATVRRRDTC